MKVDLGINPKYVRIAIWVVVAIVVIIVARKAYQKIKEYLGRKKVSDTLGQGIIPEELTYSESEYAYLAERLYGALNNKKSGLYGVDQDEVYAVFRDIKTPSDLLKLIQVFGTRDFDFAWTANVKDGKYTLYELFTNNLLTGGERSKIREILAENNIKYPF